MFIGALKRVVLGHGDKSASRGGFDDGVDTDGSFPQAATPAQYPATGLTGSARSVERLVPSTAVRHPE